LGQAERGDGVVVLPIQRLAIPALRSLIVVPPEIKIADLDVLVRLVRVPRFGLVYVANIPRPGAEVVLTRRRRQIYFCAVTGALVVSRRRAIVRAARHT